MLKTSSCNKKVVLKNTQLPSYAVSTLSSQGKEKSMRAKSAVSEKTIKVPSTSMYKDNKIYKCPVCKGSLISEGIFKMVSSSKKKDLKRLSSTIQPERIEVGTYLY
jgi:hypothetical protein